jgi:hypothetical protein
VVCASTLVIEKRRTNSKARAVIETVNEWLDGHALSDEQPEDGWGHYLFEKAENGTQPTVVFLLILEVYILEQTRHCGSH